MSTYVSFDLKLHLQFGLRPWSFGHLMLARRRTAAPPSRNRIVQEQVLEPRGCPPRNFLPHPGNKVRDGQGDSKCLWGRRRETGRKDSSSRCSSTFRIHSSCGRLIHIRHRRNHNQNTRRGTLLRYLGPLVDYDMLSFPAIELMGFVYASRYFFENETI